MTRSLLFNVILWGTVLFAVIANTAQSAAPPDNRSATLRDRAAGWFSKRAVREQTRMEMLRQADKDKTESPAFAWVRRDKIRTFHTGLGADHLRQIIPEMARLGFNGVDPAGRRYTAKPDGWRPALAVAEDLAAKYGMHVSPWLAWYWYPDDKDFPDRNCLADLTYEGEYRHAVDFRGVTMPVAPCPLADELWRDMTANARQMAIWSKEFPHLWGLCVDFEFYGPSASRQSSDWYSYDFCFCDSCFGLFLQRIGSPLRAGDVAPGQRFALLRKAEAVDAYYALLTDEVRHRAQTLRLLVQTAHPDFVFQIYGIPILPEATVADTLEKNLMWSGWFGYGLAQGLGTKRVPCVYKPLDASDPRPGRWSPTRRMVRAGNDWKYVETGKTFQRRLEEAGLHCLHVPGVVICNESPSADMGRVIASGLRDANGFWFNEGWMLLAFRDPKAPRPGWWTDTRSEPIDAYWKMLTEVLHGDKRK